MRPWLSIVLLVAAVAAAVALIQDGPAGGSGVFPVQVVGPDGTLFDGNVTARDATAFDVLVAAADAGGFEVRSTGSGGTRFVTAIAGHANQGSAGWCYDVWDGGWVRPSVGAGAYGLHDGQASRWVYEQDGCGRLA